jgi:hypothetical protein
MRTFLKLFFKVEVFDVLRQANINVFDRHFARYRHFDRLDLKYDDNDSESNNIIYLLCNVSES